MPEAICYLFPRSEPRPPSMLNFANILTMSRIAAIPAIVGFMMLHGLVWHWIALALFVLACVTDWFDGYVARRLDQVSPLGRFLDPIADKLVVAAVLLILVSIGHIDGWTILAALIILCREILVSGLREFLAELRVGVPVSMLAKWKTAVQMIALGFLILGDAGPAALPIKLIGEIGLWVAAILTLVTGYDYLVTGLRHMQGESQSSQ